jgi:hypothetical protein
MIAAEHDAVLFQPMPHDFYLAVRASGRESADGALKAIESVGFIQSGNLKRLVVVVAASIASRHKSLLYF